jgi:hypothetical protein
VIKDRVRLLSIYLIEITSSHINRRKGGVQNAGYGEKAGNHQQFQASR